MSPAVEMVTNTLLFSFILCCVVSGMLQVLAWSRHAREGAGASLRAMLEPSAYFDEVGVRQIHLARRLLLVGAAAYVGYMVVVMAFARA